MRKLPFDEHGSKLSICRKNANTGDTIKEGDIHKSLWKSKRPILHGYFFIKNWIYTSNTLRQPLKKTSSARDLNKDSCWFISNEVNYRSQYETSFITYHISIILYKIIYLSCQRYKWVLFCNGFRWLHHSYIDIYCTVGFSKCKWYQ